MRFMAQFDIDEWSNHKVMTKLYRSYDTPEEVVAVSDTERQFIDALLSDISEAAYKRAKEFGL